MLGRHEASGAVQVNERVARRREQRLAADAVQQALLQAKAREQEQFEAIKAEFGVDTSTVRSASKVIPWNKDNQTRPCW